MAMAFITLQVMPDSPEVNLDSLIEKIKDLIQDYTKSNNPENTKVHTQPVAFGLKAMIFKFAVDEAKGSTDSLEEKILEIEDVTSAEVTAVSRALG
jgi:elongation factor 1-beta